MLLVSATLCAGEYKHIPYDCRYPNKQLQQIRESLTKLASYTLHTQSDLALQAWA